MLDRIKRYLLILLLSLLIIPVIQIASLKYIDPPFWGWQIHRSLFPPKGYPTHRQHTWVDLNRISKNMQLAVIASEDQLFPSHYGFDINAILTVIKQTGANGPRRGASTITQQTAKNVFLFPAHSMIRKAVELYYAIWMEVIWGKQRILEMYLNVIEFGPGIFGVEAASQHFFNTKARYLTAQQAAQLAAVLPNPYKLKANPPSRYVLERSRWIRKQMRQLSMAAVNKLSQ
ncbi:monofunctional biosynthetic peptidoglycan transglycosylase [Photobacterium damselae subsp. damselae]|uniref:monofunctional biosynthetic peptidoglycan transglycosylase n=1 Tax=Photobacterium damselae TaxID=38293 RepID=UPI0022094E12|nr:monofunctional biosynthetic peptidoglycan transglycosylase [Photobacterium damselae]BDR33581.1 monofunctional biosynthetic peptidoglycan transglycosylase [Photobacterium damselae subsp. damselae]